MITNLAIRRGEIYWVNMDPAIGAEIKKTRPALVVSNDENNKFSPLITIIPITSTTKTPYPFEVSVSQGSGGLKKASLIKANQVRTVDKKRIVGKPLGPALSSQIMDRVAQALKVHLAI